MPCCHFLTLNLTPACRSQGFGRDLGARRPRRCHLVRQLERGLETASTYGLSSGRIEAVRVGSPEVCDSSQQQTFTGEERDIPRLDIERRHF